MKHPLVILEGVSKNYVEGQQRHVVYDNFCAQFISSERVALLGRSGCGKTTLLNLVSGIDLPDSGKIIINGTIISDLSETERTLFRRQHIGFIFQFFNLIPTLTVLENLLLPLDLLGKNLQKGKRRALSLLNDVGLKDRINSFPENLSGGEQQRIAIVRALIHEPILILADEPTGNLDSETSRQVLDLLDNMMQQNESTLIMVTHTSEAAAIADRVLSIRGSQLHPTP